MRLYVPTNGDKLRLVEEWKFDLYAEEYGNRNETLAQRLGLQKSPRPDRFGHVYARYPHKAQVSLPVGTVLQVDRVYIRKFNSASASVDDDFDSITFVVIEHPTWQRDGKKKIMARFWVKLRDANTMEFEHAAPPRWSEVAD